MVRSPGFGSIYYYYGALFRLAFTMPPSNDLSLHVANNSLDRSTKSTPSPTNWLRLLVRTQFQDLFHSPSGVLLTFPSRYLFTIDRKIYLALEGGPPGFSQGFTCPDLLDKINDKVCETWHTRLSLSLAQLSNCFCSHRKFLTLCRLMVASASNTEILDKSRTSYWLFICHNPLITFVYQLIHLQIAR